jgi:endonuclease V-like protein UPF0215 family
LVSAGGEPKTRLSHVVGFDDGPFPPGHRGDVDLIGAVFSGLRLDGVLRTRVRRDGANATERIAGAIEQSRFREHIQLILLQGIAVAGFNVVDIRALNRRLGIPVVVVSRREPDLAAVREALLGSVPGGGRKWRLIERAGPPRRIGDLWIQCAGCTCSVAALLIERLAVHGHVPEPLRTAHLIAGGISRLPTRQRV